MKHINSYIFYITLYVTSLTLIKAQLKKFSIYSATYKEVYLINKTLIYLILYNAKQPVMIIGMERITILPRKTLKYG